MLVLGAFTADPPQPMTDDENKVLTPTSDNVAGAAHAAPTSTTITPVASRKSSRVLYFTFASQLIVRSKSCH